MVTIYHNPRCRKSRAGLEYLLEKKLEPVIIDYINNPLTEEELEDLFKKLGTQPSAMIRTQEDFFRKELKGKEISEKQWLAILAEHPKLLQRPIVVKGDRAVFAQPPEKIDGLTG